MQQDAANKINFRTHKTMMVAPAYYTEGVNIGSGVQGLITYMRTDSTRISPVAQNEAATFITDRFGPKDILNMAVESEMLLAHKMLMKRFVRQGCI